ncbi:LuxR C-terminal-related transcriptional regulator [Streptomyces sp. NPDC004542]|uniref:LuxR C-terminal-related transcriptional regulator n=1 Tax=Streptomyces sp. NPDC004542 TaxID=3154281 RepID=UPI00339EDD70
MPPVNPPPLPRTSPPPPPDAAPAPAEGVRARLRHVAYGDPRAVAELLARLTERQAAGLDPLPTRPAAVAPRLLRAHRQEIRSLPDDTRLLLLLAAADQYPVATHAFLRAVAAARLDTRPLEAADVAGVAHTAVDGVEFRDTWTRIAAYEAASPQERREAHRLLARVLSGTGEAPRRSWHRAAGALGPSARLAAELRTSADRARAAGDPALAGALAERAAALCTDPGTRTRLLTGAAADAWRTGDADRARTLAARTDDPALNGVFALRAGNAAEAFDALLAAAIRSGRTEDEGRADPVAREGGGGGGAKTSGGGGGGAEALSGGGGSRGPGPGGGSGRPGGDGVEAVSARGGGARTVAGRSTASSPVRRGSVRAVGGDGRREGGGGQAVELLALATEAAVYTGDLRRCREVFLVAHWLGVPPPGALGGLAAAVEGRYEDARDLLRRTAGRCGPGGDPTLLIHAGMTALMLGDHSRAATATLRAATTARARGALATVAQAMEFRAYADFWTGRTHAAEAAAREALELAYATGQDNGACHLRAALAMFAAVTGDESACHEHARAARAHALARGLGLPAALAQWALAFLDLTGGRFPAAAARLRALAGFGPGHGHRAIRHLATPHYVEAAVRSGDTRVARAAHADYHRWASAVRSPDDLALSARCRALLAPAAEAVGHYRTALDLHARGTREYERARTELLFGSALRRLRRRSEARDRLHSALEAFESFGAPHCAARARAELRALGAPSTPSPTDQSPATARLTAQQLVIARMAAEGATNREIADRLALSPRTIDHHLRGVFARLDIRSRIELVRLLGDDDTPGSR